MNLIDRARAEKDTAYKEEMRLKCQTDHIFLAHVLGYSKVNEKDHRPIANLCVQKNPALPIDQQSDVKDRIDLDPRATFKTTMGIVDSVQWVICFPQAVRICKLTATKPLARAIANEVRDHFVKGKHSEPSDLQFLFPELVISESDAIEGEYTTPVRADIRPKPKEATVMSFSNEMTFSGWHFDVFDPDDVVDTQNSATPQQMAKVKKNFRINKKTLMHWGYLNARGTRYSPQDLWGDMLSKAKPGKTKVLVRAALKMIDGSRLEPGDFPKLSEVVLCFPELLPYEYLKKEFEDDYESFMTQYMNDAHGGKQQTFPPEMMLEAYVDPDEVPLSGQTFFAWRFSCNGKPNMRYAAGAVGIMESGRMYIVDAARGMFKPSVLAHKVAYMAKRNGLHTVTIEETPGAHALEAAIQNYAATLGWQLSITWKEFQEDEGERDLRIKGLEPLILAKRLLFSAAIGNIKQIQSQFVDYESLEDVELPDVISRVSANLPASIIPLDSDAEQDLAWELATQRDMYDRTHGLGSYAPAAPLVEEKPYTPPANSYGLPEELGGLNG